MLDEAFGPSTVTNKEEEITKPKPETKTGDVNSVLDEAFGPAPKLPQIEKVKPQPEMPTTPEPEPEPITPEIPEPEPQPLPEPEPVMETPTPPPAPMPTIPQPTMQETQPAVTPPPTPEPEMPKAAPQERKWGKLPTGHPNRFAYVEVGDPPRLMQVYNPDPDLEGPLGKPEIPEPPPAPPTMVFTEPEKITAPPPKRSSIPPPMQGYGQFPMPVQTAQPEAKETPTTPPETPTELAGKPPLSTIRSISINEDGKEVLIPTVREGLDRVMSDKEAIDWYHQTGEYLGKFDNVEDATAYANELSKGQQARLLSDKPRKAEPEPKIEIPPAMPGYGQFAQPVATAEPKPGEEKMGLPEAMGRAAAGGAAELALNIARTPQTAAEIYLSLNNLTNRVINSGIKKVTGKEKGPLPEIPLKSIPSILKLNENAWDTKIVRKFAEKQQEAIAEATNSKPFLKDIKEGNFSDAGREIAIKSAAQVPLLLSMFGGGAVGAGAKVLGAYAGTQQAASEMDRYWKDVEAGVARQSPEVAGINALVNGAIEGLGARFVTGNIIENAMKTIAKSSSEEAAKKVVGNALGAVVGEMLKTAGAEFSEETIVNYSQAVMDNVLGKRDVTWDQAIREGLEGGIIGFTTSLGIGGLSGYAKSRGIRSAEGPLTEMVDEKTGEVTPLEDAAKPAPPPPKGQLTEIIDEKTGETRPLGEVQGEIKPIEELEQQAKEKITQEPKGAKRGLQGKTETKITEEQKPEPITKEEISAKEDGTTAKERGGKEGPDRGKEGRIRVRDDEKGGMEAETGKIKTPKGVTAEVKDVSKRTNLDNEKAYEPVLDLDKKPTGWVRPKNNKSVLIDPENRKQIVFKPTNPEEATAKAKTNTAASGYAIKNPITVQPPETAPKTAPAPKEEPSEPTDKVSREAATRPAAVRASKVPKEEKQKEVTGEKKPPIKTETKKAPIAERDKQAPETKEEEYDIIDESGNVVAKGYSGAQSNEAMGLSLEDERVYTDKKKKMPVSKHTISQKLSELGRVPIRTGKYRGKRALGIFKVRPREIRVREAGNIPVIAHEIGHALERDVLEDMQFTNRWGQIRNELNGLGKALYGKNRPANGYASEGWAEYWNYYFAKGSEIEKLAPVTHDYVKNTFFKDNPKFQKKVDEIKNLVEEYKAQGPIERAKAQIEPAESEGAVKRAVESINKENYVDEFAGIESAVNRMNAIQSESAEVYRKRLKGLEEWKNRELKGASPSKEKVILKKYNRFKTKYKKAIDDNLRTLSSEENPFIAAKALRKLASSIAKTMIENGMIDFNARVVGRPLKDAASIVGKYRNGLKEFEPYLYALRAQEYHRLGLDPGLDLSDANAAVKRLEKAYPDFPIAAKIVHDWNRGVLDYANQAGAIPDEVVAKIKEKWDFYFPFERAFPYRASQLLKSKKGTQIATRAKGSSMPIRNPFETMAKEAERIISATHKRYVLDRLFELNNVEGIGEIMVEVPRDLEPRTFSLEHIKSQLEKKGIDLEGVDLEEMITTFTPAQRTKKGEPIIAKVVNENGKEKVKWYYVDEDLYQAIEGMNKISSLDPVIDAIFGKPASLFKLGTTGYRASFSFSNAMRDFGVALIQASGKKDPLSLLEFTGNVIKSDYSKILEMGGGKPSEFNALFQRLGLEMSQPFGADIKHTRRAVKDLFKGKTVKTITNPLDAFRDFIQITESGPRVAAIMKMAKERGIDINNMSTSEMFDLIIEGSEITTDFRAVGDKVRNWNRVTPFLNPKIQGTRKFLNTWKRDPKSAIYVGLVTMTLPSLINWFRNKDEEWYQGLPAYEKYLYENVEVPGDNILRIPRAHEWGLVFQTIPTMLIDAAYQKDPDGVSALFESMIRSETPEYLPHTAQVIWEQLHNKVKFTGRPIVSRGEMDKPGPEQYGPHTSVISIGIANMFKKLNWSPERIDHIIRNVFGGLGQDLLSMTRKEKSTVKELANIPVVGRFFRWGGKYSFRNKYVDEFYDLYNKYQKLANSELFKDDKKVEQIVNILEATNKSLKIDRESYKDKTTKKERQEIAKSVTDELRARVERIKFLEDSMNIKSPY